MLYDNFNIPLYDPGFRAQIEQLIKNVSEGLRNKDDAVSFVRAEMKQIFERTYQLLNEMLLYLSNATSENRIYYN